MEKDLVLFSLFMVSMVEPKLRLKLFSLQFYLWDNFKLILSLGKGCLRAAVLTGLLCCT